MSTWLKLLLQIEATDLRAGMGVGVESFSLFPEKSHLMCVSGGFVRRMAGRYIQGLREGNSY